jgi:hypothetical protein
MPNELVKGMSISPFGGAVGLLRHDLWTVKQLLKALEAKIARNDLTLTKARLVAALTRGRMQGARRPHDAQFQARLGRPLAFDDRAGVSNDSLDSVPRPCGSGQRGGRLVGGCSKRGLSPSLPLNTRRF